ncbi:hypothetical protein GCM10010909_23100 [Acidocella aquatica]|uniref:Uncharacterized protein n=1 Tax=Acidocella aquatica TaxID=1922313 RepID=A0ABQ6A587_9PROT|nr:hypothetical protein GCM10010909_23100 [Acidocella aquatica]
MLINYIILRPAPLTHPGYTARWPSQPGQKWGFPAPGAVSRVRSFEARSTERAESVNRSQKNGQSLIALKAISL